MRLEVVEVTPDMAEAWLASAAGLPQRALSQRRVLAYAHAMGRGQWQITHQAIGIDPDGVLIDGQHRLNAVVTARRTVPMMVAFDVPRELFAVIDTGTARTTASTLHIAGIPDANANAAAARLILMWGEISGSRRMPGSEVRGMFSTTDIVELMQSERGRFLISNNADARALSNAFGRYGARSWLLAGLAMVDESRPDLGLKEMFVDGLLRGAMLAEDSPLLTFRRWMTSETGYGRTDRSYRGAIGLAAFIKTWNAWLAHKSIGVIRVRPGREVWPIVGRHDLDENGVTALDLPADDEHEDADADRDALVA